MNEREIRAREFEFYMLWNDHRKIEDCKLSVKKKEDVRLAVNKAYLDMMVRTIKGLGLGF